MTDQKNNSKLIAGIDDATKCPCIGSIFLAGVVADEKTIEYWKSLGVKDSKLLTAKKREKLAIIIKKTAKCFSIEQMTPAMIDDKSLNLNEWEMLVLLKILKKLTSKTITHEIYVDNWETTQLGFKKRFKSLLSKIMKPKLIANKLRLNRKKIRSQNLIAEHKADENYTVVGAASILAKTSSDRQYRKYKKIYGDFGSGSPADPKTRIFVWKHRENPPPIVRTSWNTYKTLVNLNDIKDDPIYCKIKKIPFFL
jgi:ribonuclease HII